MSLSPCLGYDSLCQATSLHMPSSAMKMEHSWMGLVNALIKVTKELTSSFCSLMWGYNKKSSVCIQEEDLQQNSTMLSPWSLGKINIWNLYLYLKSDTTLKKYKSIYSKKCLSSLSQFHAQKIIIVTVFIYLFVYSCVCIPF